MARILVIVALLTAFLTLLCSFGSAAVIGIDMGAENIVLSTPGRTDLDAKDFNSVEIVLNTQSHRKTANWIGFRNGERFFADDAQNLAARFPDLMTAAPHRYVGLLFNDTSLQSYMKVQHYPYNVKAHPTRGTVMFEYPNAGEGGATLTYSAEELLAMVFGHLKRTAEAVTQYNEPVTAAVVTVPHFFTERQRQAVIDAAALVGIRVLSLMHPITAAAFQYGIQNEGFNGRPTTVALVDMGSGATHVGIYHYSGVDSALSIVPRKLPFSTGFGNLTALSLVSSSQISGRVLDSCVAKLIEDEFVAKTGLPRILSGSTPQQRKAIISLMRAAKKVKETLTANRFALYTVEGMAPEKDFSSRMTREFFEEHCASSAAVEIGKLVEKALAKAGETLNGDSSPLPTSSIDRLEVIGGGLRVLKLLEELQSHTSKRVDRTMNSDEAVAIGTGYRVASISGTMRIKGFALQDPSALGQSVTFTVSPLGATEDDSDAMPASPLFAFGREAYLPARRVLSLGALEGDGAAINLIYTMASSIAAGAVRKDRSIEISGLKSALETVNYFSDFQKENNATHRVKVEIAASESGILSVESANVEVTYSVNVTRTVKVPKASGNESDSNASSPNASADTKNDTNTSTKRANSPTSEEAKTIVVPSRRRRTFPLSVSVSYTRAPLPLTFEEARQSRIVLKKLDSRDEAALKLSATHNDLQSYLIWARGEGFEKYKARLTEGEKEKLSELLEKTNTWIEDEVTDNTTRAQVREQLLALREGVRRFKKIAEDRISQSTDAHPEDNDSPFATAKEPIAHSDSFIEDDGVRRSKKNRTTPEAKNGDSKEESISDNLGDEGDSLEKPSQEDAGDSEGEL